MINHIQFEFDKICNSSKETYCNFYRVKSSVDEAIDVELRRILSNLDMPKTFYELVCLIKTMYLQKKCKVITIEGRSNANYYTNEDFVGDSIFVVEYEKI